MQLKAMAFGWRRAIIADRHRQEVILNIRIRHALIRPDKAQGFKMIGRPRPCFGKQPLRANPRFGKQVEIFIKRDRLQAFHLKIHFQMILQVFTDAAAIGNRRDAMGFQQSRRPNAGPLQNLG